MGQPKQLTTHPRYVHVCGEHLEPVCEQISKEYGNGNLLVEPRDVTRLPCTVCGNSPRWCVSAMQWTYDEASRS